MFERIHLAVLPPLLLLGATSASAQTTVYGNVSGTWTLAGSPYRIAADTTVPAGQVLTIEPGVVVELFAGTSINVDGQLIALGTQREPIVFDELVDGQPWNRIYIRATNPNPPTSQFVHCNLGNATTGIQAYVYGQLSNHVTTMALEISDCRFQSMATAIYCQAFGDGTPSQRLHARIDPVIERCRFQDVNDAIALWVKEDCSVLCANGFSYPVILDNLFDGVGSALRIVQVNGVDGTPVFCNNTVLNSTTGVTVPSRFPSTIRNNIFYGVETALVPSGTHDVAYNAFYGNTTDCTNCPVSFGVPVIANANGDPCDLFSNLFLDPRLADPVVGDARLRLDSPCIDAGDDLAVPPDVTTDLAGHPRFVGPAVDIGAYELRPRIHDVRGHAVDSAAHILR